MDNTKITKVRPLAEKRYSYGNDGRDARWVVDYSCPNCKKPIRKGDIACDRCGMFFDWSKTDSMGLKVMKTIDGTELKKHIKNTICGRCYIDNLLMYIDEMPEVDAQPVEHDRCPECDKSLEVLLSGEFYVDEEAKRLSKLYSRHEV